MNDVSLAGKSIPSMTAEDIAKVSQLEKLLYGAAQEKIETQHDLHGGMYARSICIKAGVMITGALIKLPTILIVVGNVIVYLGQESIELTGYNVMCAAANRKQSFIAKSDVYMTMVFPTKATTIEEAEKEFTDQHAELLSHTNNNVVNITGEA